jgi:ribonuclease HIII
VREVARQIVAKHGEDELGKVAKLHFKTTQELRGR